MSDEKILSHSHRIPRAKNCALTHSLRTSLGSHLAGLGENVGKLVIG